MRSLFPPAGDPPSHRCPNRSPSLLLQPVAKGLVQEITEAQRISLRKAVGRINGNGWQATVGNKCSRLQLPTHKQPQRWRSSVGWLLGRRSFWVQVPFAQKLCRTGHFFTPSSLCTDCTVDRASGGSNAMPNTPNEVEGHAVVADVEVTKSALGQFLWMTILMPRSL